MNNKREGSSRQTPEHQKGGYGRNITRRGPECAPKCPGHSLVPASVLEQKGTVGRGKQFTYVQE